MCQSAVTLITNALPTVENDELLLKIKGRVTLFIQTMEVSIPNCGHLAKLILIQSWGYSVASLHSLLYTLFEKYAQLLKQKFSRDFQEVMAEL